LDKAEIVHEILTYLVDHPDAQDTLEGIVEWWLLERKIKSETIRVKEVLAELVRKELVIEHRRSDSQISYSINQAKEREIRILLKNEEGNLNPTAILKRLNP